MTELIQHKRTGIWLPKGTQSEGAIGEAYMMKDYGGLPSLVDFTDKTLLDCGGHIGCFSRRALENGAKFSHIVEPMAPSHDAIEKNLEDGKFKLHKGALSLESGTTSFYVRDDKLLSGSVIPKATAAMRQYNYKEIEVNLIPFWDLVEEVQPDVVKMDIEGAEWELMDRPLPSSVKELFMEIHRTKSIRVEDNYKQLLETAFPGGKEVWERGHIIFQQPRWAHVTLLWRRD